MFLFFFNLFLIGGYLFYSTVLVSAIHQHDSASGIHTPPPSWASLPSPTASSSARMSRSIRLGSLCRTADFHWLSISHKTSAHCLFHVYVSMLLSPFVPSSPRPGFCTTSSASQETPQSQANSPWKLQTPSFVLVSPTRLPQAPQAPGRCQYFQWMERLHCGTDRALHGNC